MSNNPVGLPSSSSISASRSSAERPSARISPTSIASSARVPSSSDNSLAARLMTVSQTGSSWAPFTWRSTSSRIDSIRDRFQTHPPARRGALHLADLRQAAMDFSLGLDGLDPAPPVTPEPQRNSRLLQGVLGRVQIDASERSSFGGAARQLQRLQARLKLSRRSLVEQEFQFDFAHVTVS